MADFEIYLWSPGGTRAADEYARVLDLHRDNRATLGHLPFAAFQEAGYHGRIVLGAIDGEVQGYVLYSTPRQLTVKLVHVCVSATARGSGLAKAMVEAVIAAHQERSIVTAHCRTDYDMDRFWRSLDMAPTSERPGRAAKGSTLTIWTRKIGQLDLMENALYDSSRPIAVLDSNVVIDLFASNEMNRPDREESRGLTADWLVDVLELAVSQEVSVEISHLQASERQRVQRSVSALVTLRRHSDMRFLAEEFIGRMPAAAVSRDRSLRNDAKHLADAVLAGADYFVTRDENFLAATAQWSQQAYAINVLRPVELLRTFIPPSAPTEFRSGQLESVGLRWTQVMSSSSDLEDAFTDVPHGEKGRNFRKLLHGALSRPATTRLEELTDERGRRWALLASEVRGNTLHIPVGRVARGSLGGTIAFQLTRYIRSLALERGAIEVKVAKGALDPVLRAALHADGFDGERLTAHLALHPDPTRTSAIRSSTEVEAYERKNWPQVLIDRDVPVRIVPIQPRYARELLGFNDTLIHMRDRPALGLAREFVYFANPKMSHWKIPTRVLWYVTKDPGVRDELAIRAVVAHSRVIDARVTDVREAIQQYRSLGVLRGKEINGHAKEGKVLVLRFEDTHMLDAPISKRAFHSLLNQHAVTTSLITTRSAPARLFDDIMRTQPGWESR